MDTWGSLQFKNIFSNTLFSFIVVLLTFAFERKKIQNEVKRLRNMFTVLSGETGVAEQSPPDVEGGREPESRDSST